MEDQPRYLSGNFAPIKRTRSLTRCSHTGFIPSGLAGGQYVRNGGNPVTNNDLGRHAHWFDGDGMLSGVWFRRMRKNDDGADENIEPHFVNQYVLTDVFLNAKDNGNLRRPILPSISTLVNGPLFTIILMVARTIILVVLSRFTGSRRIIKKISVANTGVVCHDGRALATCESGPPMRFQLPTLETVGWYNGRKAENEPCGEERPGFGGHGPAAFMREWTTGHPRVDPVTKELISIHPVFVKPYVLYSIVPDNTGRIFKEGRRNPIFDVPIPGIRSPKMMHDFGVAAHHTVILDLPLSMNPLHCISGKPVISFDPTERSRFGVFPRYEPHKIQWFETNQCVIFHTANCWETASIKPVLETCVNLLACRLTSASVLYSAGALPLPEPKAIPPEYAEDEQCRLYYYSFPLTPEVTGEQRTIRAQWALSAIPFEFPSVSSQHAMSAARYVYGCSMGSSSSYTPALGKAAKIDYLAKIDVETLISQGTTHPPEAIKGCVDKRTINEIMQSMDVNDPIKLFCMPKGWYAQEPRFVPHKEASSEDDGWLLTYVFDESQLDEEGECGDEAVSELWVIDAKNMKDVVARIRLPQRVPYGLHGAWFSENDIDGQRPVKAVRREAAKERSDVYRLASCIRDAIEKVVG